METNKTNQANFSRQLESELAAFQGDIERWRHGLNPSVIYTPGVRHLMERAEAYWLIDAIASHLRPEALLPTSEEDQRIFGRHFWKLEVGDDRSALLSAVADIGDAPTVAQEIEYTDFPLKEVAIWAGFDGRHWVLYLPSEH